MSCTVKGKKRAEFSTALKQFGCKTFTDLNKNAAFKMTLLNICDHRSEKYRFWRPIKYGFVLITDKSYLEFEFLCGEYKCVLDANIYS